MHRTIIICALAASLALGACGNDDSSDTAATDGATTTVEVTTTSAPGVTDTTAATATSTAGTDEPAPTAQAAIWPAADVVFSTPEEAAQDFVSNVLGVPPTLGEFRAGDARSGEIEVFSPGEGGGARIPRSLLLLRQLGPDDGWFILAAVSDGATITTPEANAEVEAGPTTVEGVGRGFEATLVVSASVAGDANEQLDQVIAQGGAYADTEPYEVTLDLSAATGGEVVMLLVRGGTGLETDPGEFSAIPLVVTDAG